MILIAFTGPWGSGKTTASQYLQDKHNFKKISFGKYIREEVDSFGDGFILTIDRLRGLIYTPEGVFKVDFYDPQSLENYAEIISTISSIKETYPDFVQNYEDRGLILVRATSEIKGILQIWGTNIRRFYFSDDYWLRKAENELDPRENYVIDDLRFLNEAMWVKDKGGVIVKIVPFDFPDLSEEIVSGRTIDHRSEKELGLIEADYEIINPYGEVEEFYAEIDKILENIINKQMDLKT